MAWPRASFEKRWSCRRFRTKCLARELGYLAGKGALVQSVLLDRSSCFGRYQWGDCGPVPCLRPDMLFNIIYIIRICVCQDSLGSFTNKRLQWDIQLFVQRPDHL
jgi:hypothetical protein